MEGEKTFAHRGSELLRADVLHDILLVGVIGELSVLPLEQAWESTETVLVPLHVVSIEVVPFGGWQRRLASFGGVRRLWVHCQGCSVEKVVVASGGGLFLV